jgi:hypothetical protein
VTSLYVAMQEELLVVSAQGRYWHSESHLVGTRPQCVAVDPTQPERIYCGTFGQGLWRSSDGGNYWGKVGPGITHPQITSVAAGPAETRGGMGSVWAGTEPSSLFASDDGGDSWQDRSSFLGLPSASTWSFPPRPQTHHVRWITPDWAVDGRIFVCIEAGALLRSLDGGRDWEERRPDAPMDTHTLLAHRLAPGRLYSAAGDGFTTPGRGYAESRDAGVSWKRFGEGLSHHYLWSVAVDPTNPDTVVVSAARSPQEAHNPADAESTIYRRSGGGAWEEVRAGLPERSGTVIPELATSPSEPGVLYMATNRGLYRSGDAGATWERLALPWPERFRYQHVQGLAVVG